MAVLCTLKNFGVIVMSLRRLALAMCALGALMALMAGACGEDSTEEPLRIGLLLNVSGASDRAVERQQSFELAIKHVNEAGGILGWPVESIVAESTLDPETTVVEVRRLVEEEGIHALVGPSTSASSLPVVEQVTGPAGVPTMSPSATSPLLTDAADNDFFFRTALSDRAQGPVMAHLVQDQGFSNVGVLYRDDAWGTGLFESFREAWTGPLRAVPVKPGETTLLPQLRQSADEDAEVLVLITFEEATSTAIQEALGNDLYDQFVISESLLPDELQRLMGGAGGRAYGTVPGKAPHSESAAAWERAYVEEYGALPESVYAKETYDAAIAIALAAEAAGSLEGAAIRDRLRSIGSGPGIVLIAGAEGIASGLGALARGEEVDYEGASSSMDWDAKGDLSRGHIGTWRFTSEGGVEELGVVTFGE